MQNQKSNAIALREHLTISGHRSQLWESSGDPSVCLTSNSQRGWRQSHRGTSVVDALLINWTHKAANQKSIAYVQ